MKYLSNEELKQRIEEILIEENLTTYDVDKIFFHLVFYGLILFDVIYYENDYEKCYHAVYYCEKLDKNIIIDGFFPDKLYDVDNIMYHIKRINREISSVECKLR